MPENAFIDPQVAALYDALEGVRPDLDAYAAMADEFRATSVLDLGCGTGTLACLLAQQGKHVIGVDPSAAMVELAQTKPGAGGVRWLVGDAANLPPVQVDLMTMTGNVAQVFLTDKDWLLTLRAARAALLPSGRLVFETRDPARQAWLEWTKARSFSRADVPGIGAIETWEDLISVRLPFVTFRSTTRFEATGDKVVAQSTLRFRTRADIERTLTESGFIIEDIRDAPDRPGREFVFVTVTGGVPRTRLQNVGLGLGVTGESLG